MRALRVFASAVFLLVSFSGAALAEESVTKILGTWEFDTLSFEQSTGELFEYEEVDLHFPVTIKLVEKVRGKDDSYFGLRFDNSQLKNVTIDYRVFPAALSGFSTREEIEQQWREEGYVWGNLSINASQHGFPVLSGNAPGPAANVVVFFRLFFTAIYATDSQGDYERLIGWYDAIETALKQRKAITISLKFRTIMTSGVEDWVPDSEGFPESLPPGAFHTLGVWTEITDIRVAD